MSDDEKKKEPQLDLIFDLKEGERLRWLRRARGAKTCSGSPVR